MSLIDGNGLSAADVAAVTGNKNGSWGFGGDGAWLILILLLFAAFNGNGNGWGCNGGGNQMPYILNNTQNDVQRGFDQQMLVSGINGVQTSINTLAQGQCTGFAGVNAGMNNGFAQAEIAANQRQMASMQQNWNAQTAVDQRLDTLAMNQQSCCCENRAAVADLKYTMAQESAATRANTDAKVQNVMDKLCQLEMDGIKQNYENRIAGMQQNYESQIRVLNDRLNALDRAASQNAQTAALIADNAAQTQTLEQYLAPQPVPSYPVCPPNGNGRYVWQYNNNGCPGCNGLVA
jgi:hypothetical protein